jgi:hypothetical protein
VGSNPTLSAIEIKYRFVITGLFRRKRALVPISVPKAVFPPGRPKGLRLSQGCEYPKSRAKDLNKNEIEIEKTVSGKVAFLTFLGISPFRYRDIFQKGKRKTNDGIAIRYLTDPPSPILESASTAYLDNENLEWFELFGSFEPNEADATHAGGHGEPDGKRS